MPAKSGHDSQGCAAQGSPANPQRGEELAFEQEPSAPPPSVTIRDPAFKGNFLIRDPANDQAHHTLSEATMLAGAPDVSSRVSLTFPAGGPAMLDSGTYVIDNTLS